MQDIEYSPELKELMKTVRGHIGAFAAPHWALGLPKTRSGKITRGVLRKIAAKEEEQLGDTSTRPNCGGNTTQPEGQLRDI
ncbi:TPA: hypothetical protein ACH3X1_013566 [Trebouxia sp. C0004]